MTFNTTHDMLLPESSICRQGQEGGLENGEEEGEVTAHDQHDANGDDDANIVIDEGDDEGEGETLEDELEEEGEEEDCDEDDEGSDDDGDVGRYEDDSSLLALELSHLRDSQVM